MPIYEYQCQKCNAHVEALQKMGDKPLTKCRKCGGKLEKQWSNTSFQLKGSGWYVTDYAGKKGESSEKKSSSSESTSSTETATKPASDMKETTKSSPEKGSKKASGSKSTPVASGD
jgi:putative FmdB family regulatory protein